ncbi:hypothetical protein BOX15_Mlig010352g2, partial [Macrostomum lignano]
FLTAKRPAAENKEETMSSSHTDSILKNLQRKHTKMVPIVAWKLVNDEFIQLTGIESSPDALRKRCFKLKESKTLFCPDEILKEGEEDDCDNDPMNIGELSGNSCKHSQSTKEMDLDDPLLQPLLSRVADNLKSNKIKIELRRAYMQRNKQLLTNFRLVKFQLLGDSAPVLLFHGTTCQNAERIFQTGFKIGNKQGTFGKAIYLTDSAAKAIRYCSDAEKCIVACRVRLGKVLSRNREDRNLDAAQMRQLGVDSVHGQQVTPNRPGFAFAEYAVFRSEQVLPAYALIF